MSNEAMDSQPPTSGPQRDIAGWRIGDLIIDTRRAEVHLRGQPLALDRSSYALLVHLASHAGSTIAKEALLRVGWPGRRVSENSLAKSISKLRQAICDENAEMLRVVHGYGYCLHAAVESLRPVAPEAPVPAVTPTNRTSRLVWYRSGWLTALFLLLAAGSAVSLRERGMAPPVPVPLPTSALQQPVQSLAILPFADLSEDGSLRHFCDGLADQLLDSLAQLPELRVSAAPSSFSRSGKPPDSRELSRSLGVEGLVIGSVRRSRQRLRVTVQLVGGRDGFHRWSQTFERPEAELFALQDELTSAITRALRLGVGEPAMVRRGTQVPEAYAEWLRARTLYRNDETGERRYVASLERALQLDPKFADAWIALGDVLGHNGLYADNPQELLAGRERALAAVDRGIVLAPDRPEGYLTRSVLRHAFRWDWQGALDDLDHADSLVPQPLAESLVRRARLLAAMGRLREAIALDRQATEQDPLSVGWTVLGWHLLAMGNVAEARRVLLHDASLRPDSEHTQFYLGLADVLEGQPDLAMARFELSSGMLRLLGTVIARHELAQPEAVKRALATLRQRYPDAGAYFLADAYAWLGDSDSAFAALRHAREVEDAGLTYVKFDPLLKSLREDSRYRALLGELNFPSDSGIAQPIPVSRSSASR